jgi:hypothetical protein
MGMGPKQCGSVIIIIISNTTSTSTACLILNLVRRVRSLAHKSLEYNYTVNGTGLKFPLTTFEFWPSDSDTVISWLHVKGHAQQPGMVSKCGLAGSEGNEAADACATNGKRGHTPRPLAAIIHT